MKRAKYARLKERPIRGIECFGKKKIEFGED
jgi:hypothetical protein